jgi:hypothetical protein
LDQHRERVNHLMLGCQLLTCVPTVREIRKRI